MRRQAVLLEERLLVPSYPAIAIAPQWLNGPVMFCWGWFRRINPPQLGAADSRRVSI